MDNDPKGERYLYHEGNTKIGYNTLCIFHLGKELGFIIMVNDIPSQERVTHIENNIEKMLNKEYKR